MQKDNYGGISITDMNQLPDTEAEFEVLLAGWLEDWTKDKVRSVQISFRPPKCHLMNVAHRHGFYFHHAKDNYVLMILWMDKSMPNRMPGYADHYIGLGGVVLNNKN